MFLYGLDRFSVDLDFDLREWNLQEVLQKLEKILSVYGEIIERKNTKLLLRYRWWNIPLKIEINTRFSKYDTYENVLFFWFPILVMDRPSMFANKLYTIFQRKERSDKVASRDVYDTRFFFKNHWNLNEPLLRERSGKSIDDYLTFIKKFIWQNFTEKTILLWLWELLNEKQKFFVKNKLIQELLWQIDFYKKR